MIEAFPIDENTPRDRPILVVAKAPDDERDQWPLGFMCCVAEWYETRMLEYLKKRYTAEELEQRDTSSWRYWAVVNPPQVSIDNYLDFEPTHWCELSVLTFSH